MSEEGDRLKDLYARWTAHRDQVHAHIRDTPPLVHEIAALCRGKVVTLPAIRDEEWHLNDNNTLRALGNYPHTVRMNPHWDPTPCRRAYIIGYPDGVIDTAPEGETIILPRPVSLMMFHPLNAEPNLDLSCSTLYFRLYRLRRIGITDFIFYVRSDLCGRFEQIYTPIRYKQTKEWS
jgi:hypothetical protein